MRLARKAGRAFPQNWGSRANHRFHERHVNMNVRVLVLASVFLVATAAAYPTPLATPIIPSGIPALTVSSTTFANGAAIPGVNVTPGCGTGAANISPQLSWTAGPPGT